MEAKNKVKDKITSVNKFKDSKILKVYYDSKRRYGAPKIFKILRYSYSKKGYPYDNSCIESFHSVLKRKR